MSSLPRRPASPGPARRPATRCRRARTSPGGRPARGCTAATGRTGRRPPRRPSPAARWPPTRCRAASGAWAPCCLRARRSVSCGLGVGRLHSDHAHLGRWPSRPGPSAPRGACRPAWQRLRRQLPRCQPQCPSHLCQQPPSVPLVLVPVPVLKRTAWCGVSDSGHTPWLTGGAPNQDWPAGLNALTGMHCYCARAAGG